MIVYQTILLVMMILGGGIAGLYSAYQLLKKNPDRHLVILDKRDRWGGRIYTHKDQYMTVETGAGRFNNNHPLLLELIHELHLEKHIKSSSADYEYVHPSPFSMKTVLLKIITAGEIDPFHDLKQFSFLDYASKIVSKEEISKFFIDSPIFFHFLWILGVEFFRVIHFYNNKSFAIH
jgi:monoamine oxidase